MGISQKLIIFNLTSKVNGVNKCKCAKDEVLAIVCGIVLIEKTKTRKGVG